MSTQTLDDFRLRNELRDALIEAELWPLLRMRRWVTMFSHEFADQVRYGEKIQTIRATRRIEHCFERARARRGVWLRSKGWFAF